MSQPPRIVVIGASAGGVESLREVVSGIPADFAGAIFVVLHVPPYQQSSLPEILSRAGALPACHPQDGATIEAGRIYVAPPDHHMLVDGRCVAVKKGPKENRFRPSIDALFRSAAYNYRQHVIGVVLSGALDDGTSGLWSIKRLGGVAVVQEPADSRFESMPLSAIDQVDVDFTSPASQIGPLVGRLAAETRPAAAVVDIALRERLHTELEIAAEDSAFQKGVMDIGELTPFTCPECHGVLVKLKEDKMTRYRCHTGHAYSDSALLQDVMEHTEELLSQVMRSMEEGVMLLQHMAQHMAHAGKIDRAKILREKAAELEGRSKIMQHQVLTHEMLSGDSLVGDDQAGRP